MAGRRVDVKISNLISSEAPPDSQVMKRAVMSEDLDVRGVAKRYRIIDQTIFDVLFLAELITAAQYEAAHLFLECLIQSGATTQGVNLEPGIRVTGIDISNSMSDRRMAFSSSFRAVVSSCGRESADFMMRCFIEIYSYPDFDKSEIAERLAPCLHSLAAYFGTDGRDPRSIIRRGFNRKRPRN